jgi:tRNA-2-methylthio-N6-dimethylallyladenosine synthase
LRRFRSSTTTVLYGNWLIGFPDEQDVDFEDTVNLMRDLNFHINVVIPFSARPGTPAYDMDHQVDTSVVNLRIDALTELAAELKSEMMRADMRGLSSARQEELLGMVRRAERDQYSPPPPRTGRAIPLIVQTS